VVLAATVALQRRGKHATTTIEGLCFLRGSCQGVILKKTGATVQLPYIRRTATTWTRKAVESSLLEAVVRELLLKTQQAGKMLSGCCGDLSVVKISSGAVIKSSSSGVHNWLINTLTNPYPVWSHTPKSERFILLNGMWLLSCRVLNKFSIA
jgi:hypothetical protein